MSNVVPIVGHLHLGQHYDMVYNPEQKCWVWVVHYQREYEYIGAAASPAAARKQVEAEIARLTDNGKRGPPGWRKE